MLTTCYYAQNNASIFYTGQATGSPPVIPSCTYLMLLGSLTFQRGMGGCRMFILFSPIFIPSQGYYRCVWLSIEGGCYAYSFFPSSKHVYVGMPQDVIWNYWGMGIWHSGPQENMHIAGHLCDVPQTSYLVHASYYNFKKALHENQADVHFHQITRLEGVLLEGALHMCCPSTWATTVGIQHLRKWHI